MSLALAACLAAGPCAAASHNGGTFAAISIAARRDASVRVVIGEVTKHPANPLFTRDQPWESRIDNGYTSVVPPSEEGGEWKCSQRQSCKQGGGGGSWTAKAPAQIAQIANVRRYG